MKYAEEFRDPARLGPILAHIEALLARIDPARLPLQIMEVCGGHTWSIFRYGLDRLLPAGIEWVHGPGCPVCVLPMEHVAEAVALARRPEVILTTFGDAMRVPGRPESLLTARAQGADVRMLYSPLDALALARSHPERQVVFFAIGFDTTMPATALCVQQARAEGISNFTLLCHHIALIPTLRAVVAEPGMRLDGLIGPGHVSMVIGTRPYQFLAEEHRLPLVVAGFEPLDLLQALIMLLEQIAGGRAAVENQYRRVVPEAGNEVALAAMHEVFAAKPASHWRGLGEVSGAAMGLSAAYADFDAALRFGLAQQSIHDADPDPCRLVLRGQQKPHQCPLYGGECTPEHPVGALMVSGEGACAASFRFGGGR